MQKIEKKIVAYKVVNKDKEEEIKQPEEVLPTDRVVEIISAQPISETININMGEHVERLEVLDGKTYKIKPSTSEHAYYITINNIEVEGKLHPYEVFINSLGIEVLKLQAFTRLISAVFRKGGDVTFMSEELKQLYDIEGPYTSKRTNESGKRKRFNSILAELGDIIEEHLFYLTNVNKAVDRMLSYVRDDTPLTTEETWQLYKENDPSPKKSLYNELPEADFPPNATICSKCNHKSVIILDNCATCLNCGDSKCG